ncbi:MAG: dTDP-4-dehydrorhamnose reductase [Verrucomicrobiota bacterium]
MRIIITGTGGRLGAATARFLRDRHRVIAWDRKAMDLKEPERILDHFGAVQFDAVIHCAALTAVDYCEQHPDEARAVNTEAPALMAKICRERGARLIHVSTDYVYDGRTPGLRVETDPTAPLGVYAASKRAAEEAVLAASADFLVARTSWVFGPDRASFADTVLDRARREADGGAIADKWGTPSYSHDAAALLEALLLNPDATGIVNLCNAGACSWLEYGQACLDLAAEAGIPLKCRTLKPLRLAEMSAFTAPRPVHTAMDTTRLATLTGLRVRPWREALAEYIQTYHAPARS